MVINGVLLQATFLQRLTRFSALVETMGSKRIAYLPNSGRMKELLSPSRRVLLLERASSNRKNAYDLIMVDLGSALASVDARLPNLLVYEAIREGAIANFKAYSSIRMEAPYGESRFDLLLEDGSQRCLIEVKSCTLVRQGRGLFPDAPTARGARHLRELAEARGSGYEAAVIFVIQREDADSFSQNDETDPGFGRALRQAVQRGVKAYAYRCRVTAREVTLDKEISLCL